MSTLESCGNTVQSASRISKKHFRLGGIAPSVWTRSVRAVRDTPVADHSAPCVNTTRHIAYHPPIAVSLFLLALSVYTKYTLYLPIIWSHSLFLRFRESTQLRRSSRPGSITSSHPHPTLLEPGWLLIMAWRDREGGLNFMFLGDGRGDGTNHDEKLGLRRISCASQFTIPDTAGTSRDPACDNTDTRSSQPNHASCTNDFSYPLVSSTSFSSSSHLSLFLIHISTIIAEHKVKSSLSISPWHDHELTPSTAYTEYSIHRVQHTPSTAYTECSTQRFFVFPSLSWLQVESWMQLQLPACLHTRSTAISQLSMRAQR